MLVLISGMRIRELIEKMRQALGETALPLIEVTAHSRKVHGTSNALL